MTMTQPVGTSEAEMAEAAARAHERYVILVHVLRIAFLVLIVGGWEVAAREEWIDPFFFGIPTGIAEQAWIWATEGTAQGSLWVQIAVTLEETALGFLIGAGLGIVFGIALGRVRLLADVFSIYIKIANSVPRVVLGSIFIIAF